MQNDLKTEPNRVLVFQCLLQSVEYESIEDSLYGFSDDFSICMSNLQFKVSSYDAKWHWDTRLSLFGLVWYNAQWYSIPSNLFVYFGKFNFLRSQICYTLKVSTFLNYPSTICRYLKVKSEYVISIQIKSEGAKREVLE